MIIKLLCRLVGRPCMEITLNPAASSHLWDVSERWYEGGRDFATVGLAGSKLHVSLRKDGYALTYMGYQTTGFKTAAEARKAAPRFACAVFDQLKQRVMDYPPQELRNAQMDQFDQKRAKRLNYYG